MDLKKIKKLGNKIYSLGVKIDESKNCGMITRIPDFYEKLKNCSDELAEELKNPNIKK